ncbi:MAG: alpha/beta hydrolase [Oscillospiraceae bacterium]|nr:alpha/beta hydrolase [Oscillospiraceae bacterium]
MIDHSPFTRKGSGKNAVLLIHGIAGSPGHFRELIPAIPETYSIYNILLDGHSGKAENLGRSSMKKWKAQVQATLAEAFNSHEKVVIVAHSMGTLFAIQAAIDHPDNIPCLFLLAVPTRPWVRFSTLITAVQIAFGKLDTPATQAMRGETALELTPKLWKYIGWAPRMIELLTQCRRTRKILPLLQVPTQTFQSQEDELVSARSCGDLEHHPIIRNTVLTGSGHFVYGAEDAEFLRAQLRKTLQDI